MRRHFLTLLDLSKDELSALTTRAIELKHMVKKRIAHDYFSRRVMGMIFDKSSTRTRVSFETGMTQFGGHAIFLSPRDTQLGRGEPIEDSARVLSRMVDIIMIRTYAHENIQRFASYSQVPVINTPSQIVITPVSYSRICRPITNSVAISPARPWPGLGMAITCVTPISMPRVSMVSN